MKPFDQDLHFLNIISGNIHLQLLGVEPRHEISNNVVCVTSKASDQPAHAPILIRAFVVCIFYEF